jgi:hypothetical protein
LAWETWAIPLAGLASAGATLLVSRAYQLARKRKTTPKETDVTPDAFQVDGARDKRQSFRRGGKQTKVLVSDSAAGSEPVVGLVLDRSVSGLGLLLEKPVPENTILSVRTTDAPEATPWVQIQVRRCQAKDERWEVGCVFVRTPPWSILLHFG